MGNVFSGMACCLVSGRPGIRIAKCLLISGRQSIPKGSQTFQLWDASFNGLLGCETLTEGAVLFG